MGRKKKEEKPIELSNYQLAIIDFIKNGQGNLVVEAAAGAGKTFTLIKCIEEIPGDKSILLTAFNSDIAKVLKRITTGGALALSIIAALPIIFGALTGLPSSVRVGGTGLLIVVGVALETYRQIDSELVTRKFSRGMRGRR